MSSLLASFLLAAETAGEETSKTPFYVAGGALALFAVLVGAFGLMKADFPTTKGAERMVVLVAAVLTVAAMATSAITG